MAIEDAIQAPYAPVSSPEELMDTTGSLIDAQDDGSVVILYSICEVSLFC